jgi:hydroxypyruvate reductase
MSRSSGELRRDAIRIWQAGVEAVRADRLIAENLQIDGNWLLVGEEELDLNTIGRIAVVGAGKAGAGMAEAVETILGPKLRREKQLAGWINVPADCVRPLECIHLHAGRPAGINEPRPEGVFGSQKILQIVESLGPNDLCLGLLSGGGSALLPYPVEGVTLEDKLALTRHLSAAGANIDQLNAVRKQLSRIKGGGLSRACRAGMTVSLIISDVPGDRIEVIASGPTAEDASTPETALRILDEFHAKEAGVSPRVFEYLQRKISSRPSGEQPEARTGNEPSVFNFIIGNNATAVDAAGMAAERLGYSHAMSSSNRPEGYAEDLGRHLAEIALRMRTGPGPDCLITGGEPVVRLVESSRRGIGGRNQQLMLAALDFLSEDGASGVVMLSGGTDGEDGPTDAAGALISEEILATAKSRRMNPRDFLERNDTYHFFAPLGGLLKTGPTETNVCDLRVIVVDR